MTTDVASRIRRTQAAMADEGVDGLIVTPGPDLRYLTGYAATALERLTALVLPAAATPYSWFLLSRSPKRSAHRRRCWGWR